MPVDRQMQKAVLDELDWAPRIVAAHIGVTAADGVVTLTGHVDDIDQKLAVEAAVARIRGVRAVVEEIQIAPPSITRMDDDTIAMAAVDRLDWNAAIALGRMHVMVEKGWITLTGIAGSDLDRQAAIDKIKDLNGVVGVSDQIVLEPKVDGDAVQINILNALHRSGTLDPKQIQVAIDGGDIRLTGRVAHLEEWLMAAAIAQAAPGASLVINEIHIGKPVVAVMHGVCDVGG